MVAGPRIYNLFPLLVGHVEAWSRHLPRIAEMGFDWVFVNQFHASGFSGSLYATKDYYRLDPRFGGRSRRDDDALIGAFVEAADRHGISVMADFVINHTARDCVLVDAHPGWYVRTADGGLSSPRAVDPDDPHRVTVWGDLAEIDYAERPERATIVAYWIGLVDYYRKLGIRGLRADAAYKVPAAVWREIIATAHDGAGQPVFFAETLGCRPDEVAALAGAGFGYLFNSSKWWDFRSSWLLEQYDSYRRIAPSVAFPESHDTERVAAELAASGIVEPEAVAESYRQRYLFAAAFSAGVMMPIGYEYGFQRRLDVVGTTPADWEEPRFDLSAFIADANRMKATVEVLNVEGPQRSLPLGDGAPAALMREGDGGAWALTLVNARHGPARELPVGRLAGAGLPSSGREVSPGGSPARLAPHAVLRLRPGEVRVFAGGDARPGARRRIPLKAAAGAGDRIVIADVQPQIDCGRHPVKREVGSDLDVWADIFVDGHERLAAVLKLRRPDEPAWREVPMRLREPGLDRWCGSVRLEEIGRLQYCIEAWIDVYESWLDGVRKKRQTGQDIALDLGEGRALLEAARARAAGTDLSRLLRLIAVVDEVPDTDARVGVLDGAPARTLMARLADRTAAAHSAPLDVRVDRLAARFAAWYEMVPRSQGREPGRSATFRDCVDRLDDIAAMGFDVVYFPPIHPIGTSKRKGRNNAVVAAPGDPGSPYAIGAGEGGHDAIHPELGSRADFQALMTALRERGMELALDFAVQCSLDHPWLKQHPEWFQYRSDGSIRHAENPPKKYEDIVNLDFSGEHREAIWHALRDVVLFWVGEGVRIFRVDNPHTKPVPFWEWLIRTVQDEHPDVLFLSEAFTRPKMLRKLAKAGFTQSYTYFTWRNSRDELTQYMEELAHSESAQYLRPNFFTNTPDILPTYLQTGGRPAFAIRFVLAATLSGVYGIHNGFELCENVAVPGMEEYLDSEKYEYKTRDWNAPGNIKPLIAAVNRIRRDNPALHDFRNIRFHPAGDENVLAYFRSTCDRSNVLLVAVNLDPVAAHTADIAWPCAARAMAAGETCEVEDLLEGGRRHWRGGRHRVTLDPQSNPAAIYRLQVPQGAGDAAH